MKNIITLKLFLSISIIVMVNQSLHSGDNGNPISEIKKTSEIKVAFYSVHSNKFDVVFYSLLDSLSKYWDCSNPKFLSLTFNAESKNIVLSSNSGFYYNFLFFFYLQDTLMAFEKDGSIVFCQQIKENRIPFFDSIKYLKTIPLNELLKNNKLTTCNAVKYKKKLIPLYYTNSYILKGDTIEFERYGELLEIGDLFLGRDKKEKRMRKKYPKINQYYLRHDVVNESY